MTLPLFLVAPERLAGVRVGAAVVLDGPEGRHAATVRRIGVGASVLLSDGRGTRATARVVATGKAELELTVTAVEQDPEPALRLVLVQALAKADRDDQAIESATELGVDEVVPWQAARSIVVWRGERAAKALRKWESVVTAAAKQARRSRVPVVAEPVTQRALVERIRGSALALVLHEDATTPPRHPEPARLRRRVGGGGARGRHQPRGARRLRAGRGRGRAAGLDRPEVVQCRAGGVGGAQRGVTVALSPQRTVKETRRSALTVVPSAALTSNTRMV